jgi:hypothetical protein
MSDQEQFNPTEGERITPKKGSSELEEEVGSSQEQENLSPFKVEPIQPVYPTIKNDQWARSEGGAGRLLINGEIQQQYNVVQHLSFQKNNPNLLSFRAKFKASDEEAEYMDVVVDSRNPDRMLLTIKNEKKYNYNNETVSRTFVNGKEWNSLERIYNYDFEIDPDGKKIVFYGPSGNGAGNKRDIERVIVNNEFWETQFPDGIAFATSVGGTVYALGGGAGLDKENKLVIEDKEWHISRLKAAGDDRKDSIGDVKLGKTNTVVALVSSSRQNLRRQMYISVGDRVGEKYVWKNTLRNYFNGSNNIAIDDENGHIAVFGLGEEDGKAEVIIDDIPYKVAGNPERLQYLNFENGGLIVQYENVLGEKITEKISLRENAKAVQEMKEKKEAADQAWIDLQGYLAQEGIRPTEVVKLLETVGNLEKTNKKNEDIKASLEQKLTEERGKRENIDRENAQLKAQLAEQASAHKIEVRDLNQEVAETRVALRKLQNMLNNAGKVMLSPNFKLSPEEMKSAREAINKALEGEKNK